MAFVRLRWVLAFAALSVAAGRCCAELSSSGRPSSAGSPSIMDAQSMSGGRGAHHGDAAAAGTNLFWNVGSQPPVDVSRTSMHPSNDTVLFTTYFGAYPLIRQRPGAGEGGDARAGDMQWCNGGIPQLANLTRHEELIAKDVEARVPDPDYDGLIVVDYESWRAVWNFTSSVYQNASVALVNAQMPGIPPADAEAEAVLQFNAAAMGFLEHTLRYGASLRPKARWGLYGYPRGSYWSELDTSLDDSIAPLWKASGALFPSTYIAYKSGVDAPFARNEAYINRTLTEAQRIATSMPYTPPGQSSTGPTPVYPYAWYRYHDGEPSGLQMLTDQDTALEFQHALTPGLFPAVRGIVVWGSEGSNATAISEVENYLAAHADVFGTGPEPPTRPASRRATPSPQVGNGDVQTFALDRDVAIPPYTPCSL